MNISATFAATSKAISIAVPLAPFPTGLKTIRGFTP